MARSKSNRKSSILKRARKGVSRRFSLKTVKPNKSSISINKKGTSGIKKFKSFSKPRVTSKNVVSRVAELEKKAEQKNEKKMLPLTVSPQYPPRMSCIISDPLDPLQFIHVFPSFNDTNNCKALASPLIGPYEVSWTQLAALANVTAVGANKYIFQDDSTNTYFKTKIVENDDEVASGNKVYVNNSWKIVFPHFRNDKIKRMNTVFNSFISGATDSSNNFIVVNSPYTMGCIPLSKGVQPYEMVGDKVFFQTLQLSLDVGLNPNFLSLLENTVVYRIKNTTTSQYEYRIGDLRMMASTTYVGIDEDNTSCLTQGQMIFPCTDVDIQANITGTNTNGVVSLAMQGTQRPDTDQSALTSVSSDVQPIFNRRLFYNLENFTIPIRVTFLKIQAQFANAKDIDINRLELQDFLLPANYYDNKYLKNRHSVNGAEGNPAYHSYFWSNKLRLDAIGSVNIIDDRYYNVGVLNNQHLNLNKVSYGVNEHYDITKDSQWVPVFMVTVPSAVELIHLLPFHMGDICTNGNYQSLNLAQTSDPNYKFLYKFNIYDTEPLGMIISFLCRAQPLIMRGNGAIYYADD